MQFKIGDNVVYPFQGAGTIAEICHQTIDGKIKDFFEVDFVYGNVKMLVPVENAENVGMRKVIEKDEIQKILDHIAIESLGLLNQNWNKRQKECLERIKTADIYEIASIYKHFCLREKKKTLSSGEKKMMNSVMKSLLSEIHLASGKSLEEVENLVNDTIAGKV